MFTFTIPLAIANGGPSFEQLYKDSHGNQEKPKVELIDQANKGVEKKICLINVAQNKVKQIPC